METILDLRSDTVTKPTEEMRRAMYSAEVGDDMLDGDPTVKRLEEYAAGLFGKEAALLTLSGTMSNQTAVLSLAEAGTQIILHDRSHMYNLEDAALGRICGVTPRPLPAPGGIYSSGDLEANLITEALQTAPVTLVCLEDSFDLNLGLVIPQSHIDSVCRTAHTRGIPVYMDGARVLNAAAAAGTSPARLCRDVDAVSVCLSKGLGCPAGSLLMGTAQTIRRARRMRQMLGGGMRQAGILAAAGLTGLKNYSRLKEDNEKASALALLLKETGAGIDLSQVQTNIIRIDLTPVKLEAEPFCRELAAHGVRAKPTGRSTVRMITHLDIPADSLKRIAEAAAETIRDLGR